MSRAFYPKPTHPQRRQRFRRGSNSGSRRYLVAVFAKLKQHPDLFSVVKQNYQFYLQQKMLRRGSLKTLERFGWIIETAQSIDDVEKWVMEDSYIGAKFQAFPLLFKGVLTDREKEDLRIGAVDTQRE